MIEEKEFFELFIFICFILIFLYIIFLNHIITLLFIYCHVLYFSIYIRNLNKYAIAMIQTQDHLKQNNLNTYVSIPLSHNSIISYVSSESF